MQTSIEGFQLSPQQLRLCLVGQGHDSYHAYCSILLTGSVDKITLKRAINHVVAQNVIFRTAFYRLPGMKIPIQVVRDAGEVAWQYYDLREYMLQEQDGRIEEISRHLQEQPVALEDGPFLYCTFITLSDDRHILLTWMHALHADNGTLHLFIRKVADAYGASLVASQDEESIQYVQVSEWQNELLIEEDADEGKAWWSENHWSDSAASSLPHEQKPEHMDGFIPTALVRLVDTEIQARLEDRAAYYDVSPSTYLLACWNILLWRLTGQGELLVSVGMDGRTGEELSQVAGPLTKYVPLLSRFHERQSVAEVLTWVKEALDEIQQWQLYFCYQQDTGSAVRSASFPCIPFSFEYSEWPADYTAGPITFSLQTWNTYLEPFKVKMFARQNKQTLTLEFQYDTALFHVDVIQRLSEQYFTLLACAVNQPTTLIGALDVLGQSERTFLLTTLNDTATTYPEGECLHQLFETQVLKSPAAIALRGEQHTVTYSELDQRANQVAHYLLSLGIESEALVGIYMERSVEMVIGILGILKAGGAYVPLDPLYPPERLTFMIADAGISVVLSQQHLIKDIPQVALAVALDQYGESIAQHNDSKPPESINDAHLAYIIYTSGSTGIPKGVMISHRGLVNYLHWCCQYYALASGNGSVVHSSPAFDLTITSLFAPLLVGSTVHLLPDTQGVEGLGKALLQGGDYSLIKVTPAHLDILNHTFAALDSISATRVLVIGGEALQGETLNLWRTRAPEIRLVNEYGPTETVVGCCIYEVPGAGPVYGNVPIGRPIANTQLYLLNTHLQPVPLGVSGELYIGGHGVARGYLHQAALTAERFIPNPFTAEAGARLYKTGDLACHLPDGNLKFLGRADHQIKIRGFRIELGEIEAVLCQHPAVGECVVLAREDGPADRRLVAYVTINQVDTNTGDDLRRYLHNILPEYMLPSAFVFLKALPLTLNGKVDRKALPVPDTIVAQRSKEVSLPRDPVEQVLVAMWQKLLRVDYIGINDDFFNLGGHSILATQLVSRVWSAFQVEVPLLDFFEAPTIAELAAQVKTLLHAEQKAHMPLLVAVSREQSLPLSFAQQRLWFLDQLEPGTSSYIIPTAVRLRGPLDVSALQRSLEELVRRHEILRTTFHMQADQPVQVINQPTTFDLLFKDLRGYEITRREEEVRRLIQEDAECPFDLVHGPLLRTTLLQLEKDEHVLLHTMHHIISDGWSSGVLVREVTALYNAFVAGKPSPLPELPLQYADYSVWQRQWLQGEVLDAQIRYWTQQLAEITSLDLPLDHPRPSEQTFHGLRQSFHLPAPLSEALKRLGQQQEATLFMTLLAAFQVLLARYTGQNRIPVGTPIANRIRAEVEELIGFFINTLVLYVDLAGNPTFLEVLARVRTVCYGAYAHQDMPFEKLVEILQPERDLSRSPLFQVMFMLQNTPQEDAQEWRGITWQTLTEEKDSAKFELTLSMVETAEGLYGTLEYNTDLFEADTIARLIKYFCNLLEGVVLHPEQRLADLPLLDETELHYLLIEQNATHSVYPTDICLHQLFEEQVTRTPHAIAILDEHQHMSYDQLNMQANRLARTIRGLGVDQGRCVGIYLERSCSLVIAILAVLKAGGTYLPLDPGTPIERLHFMLTDTGAILLLTQNLLAERSENNAAPMLLLDQHWDQWQWEEATNLQLPVAAQQAAYIIYTSGSTGLPKGVVGPHRGIVNRLNWAWQCYPFVAGERCCQKTSVSFVDAIAELFAPLLAGIPTRLLAGEHSSDPQQLVAVLVEEGISRLVLVPSLLRSLLYAYPDLALRLPWLAYWVCSGEALPLELVRRFQQVLQGRHLLNLYGSSEVAADATAHEVIGALATASNIPIGRPLANTQVYLLDQFGQPVPIGVKGEIYIGGEGLAWGYFGRVDLTAENFVPNAWCGKAGERMYRTGDLARWLVDGTLEYLGRSDYQVKVRGFRIELGEVETALTQHPLVHVAVVTAYRRTSVDSLVAYIVPASTASEQMLAEFLRAPMKYLRSYLQKKLPEYMLPSFFVVLDVLPLTSSGKVDRGALPSPDEDVVQRDQQLVEPRTPLEEVLMTLWRDVLGVQHVGIYDNFFELGGHSLLATQVISRIRAMMHVNVPLRSLFDAHTIAELAAQIELLLRHEQHRDVPPIVPVSREALLPLSFAQQRLWFLHQWEPQSPYYNIVGAVRLEGLLDHTALEHSFATIVQRHEVLRTTFNMLDAQPIQIVVPVMHLSLPIVDLSILNTSQREMLIQRLTEQESQQPFSLIQGPLLRLTLLRVGSQDHVLLLTIHHIVFDGWSLGVFIHELATLYQAYRQGLTSPLPPLPVQYADYAVWQRQWLQGEVLEAQVGYWRAQLADAPTHLELPLDHPRPAFQDFRGDTYHFALSAALTQELKLLSQREGVTLFMTLLAAFQVLLARYSGQRDIVVGTGIANRTRADIEGLIGFFVNTLALRTDVSENPTFVELLSQVRRITLEAYAHQDLPFEYLVEALQPERNLSYAPFFQVAFVLQNMPTQRLELPGITLCSLETTTHTAKNDLTLYMYEDADSLNATLEYNTALFGVATIAAMAQHMQTLLAGIVADPFRSVMTLPLLTLQEQQKILIEWNATQTPALQAISMPELFEAQVMRTPETVALVFDGQQLTYKELNRRANQLACSLRQLGVKPDMLVGLCLERSLDMIIGLLGILKAGGAYLPLDPAYPQSRLEGMLQTVICLLTQQQFQTKLPSCQTIVCLDTSWPALLQQNDENVKHMSVPEHLAYVIYTSGSTGHPKGVQVTHQGINNLVTAQRETFSVQPGDHVLQFASLSFDASVFEIVMALLTGATLVLERQEALLPGPGLIELLREQAITVVTLPPSVLIPLPVTPLPALETIIVAGEACPVELVAHWAAGRRFFNAYGPTEATVWSSVAECRAEDQQKPCIGGPITNTELYVLDRYFQPVPIGVPGELYIGSPGLARGYLLQPELTAERFIPHPWGHRVGARLYRTGDLVRYQQDGRLEFVGRVDQQVKLRGYRIELGEIEACLRAYSMVQDAAALVREDIPSDRQLVAYVVPASPSQLPVDHLQVKQNEYVGHWQALYEDIYAQTTAPADPLFNIIGWNSSYTGLPLPAEHMSEWVEQTAQQLQALHPQHILEIGCGTGLLLHKLAPHCQRYVGTDFSPAVLAALQKQVQQRGLDQVQLQEQHADQLEGWPSASFDLVLLNSVIQYFPSLNYLQQVLHQAMRLLRPGGVLFVGDVRHLPLLDTFHASVELAQRAASQSVGYLRQCIVQRRESEEELVVAPAFFRDLCNSYSQLRQVQIRPKRGWHYNELTCYRYDVLLHVGGEVLQDLEPFWIDWHEQNMTMETLRQWLSEQQPELVGLSRVPNARLQDDLLAYHVIDQAEETMTIGNLRATLHSKQNQEGVDPEEFWKLAQELSYVPELSWASGRLDGSYEVFFRRPELVGRVNFPIEEMGLNAKRAMVNTPLVATLRHSWLPDLRSYLQDRLPEYMIPSIFVPLECLPMTPNGKLDRRALPVPRQERPTWVGTYAAPFALVEELLAGLWTEVLGLEQIGRHDNFFELGGHSLLATQLISRIRVTFQVELPLRQFFASPTVAGLAKLLEKVQQSMQPLQAPPLLPVSHATALPLSFAQQRLWFLDQLAPGNTAYLMPNAWQISGALDTSALHQSLQVLVQRHETLRTTFYVQQHTSSLVQRDQPLQIIHPAEMFFFPLIDLRGLALEERENEVQRLISQEVQRPCDLEQGPLFRVYLLRLEKQEHLLLLTLHHIISDGWSMQVLARELTILYRAFAAGQSSPLPPLPIQYADFSVWQRQWLQGEVLDAQLAYWWKQLAGAPALALPVDYSRPPVQRFKGEVYPFVLPTELSHTLMTLSRQEGATLFMTLLAAFQILLYRYTNQEDIVLGTDSANRNRAETEGIIGFFINLLVLRTDLRGKPSFREVLQRVRETVLGAYMHQETPFELLVERLAPAHTLDRTPLVQALFVLQNLPPLEEQGALATGHEKDEDQLVVTLQSLAGEVRTAKFDLAVFLREQAGQLHGTVDYNVDLFRADTIVTMMARFEILLCSIARQPDISLDLLDFFTPTEQKPLEQKGREQYREARLRSMKGIDVSGMEW